MIEALAGSFVSHQFNVYPPSLDVERNDDLSFEQEILEHVEQELEQNVYSDTSSVDILEEINSSMSEAEEDDSEQESYDSEMESESYSDSDSGTVMSGDFEQAKKKKKAAKKAKKAAKKVAKKAKKADKKHRQDFATFRTLALESITQKAPNMTSAKRDQVVEKLWTKYVQSMKQ